MKVFGLSTKVLAVLAPVAVGLLYVFWWRRRQELDEDGSDLGLNRKVTLGSSKTNRTTVNIFIPAAAVGWVIGRGGQNIRKIEHQTGCRVKVQDRPPRNKGDCTVSLSGHPDQVTEAEEHIRALVSEKLARDAMARAARYEEELMVPADSVGRLIGRQGQSIRSIERSSGARLRVEKVSGDGRQGYHCVITGTLEQVGRARDCVEQKLAEEDIARRQRETSLGNTRKPTTLPTDYTDYHRRETEATRLDWSKLVARLPTSKDHIPVYVSALCDVHRFWVQYVSNSKEENGRLERLVDAMTEDYESRDSLSGTLSVASVGDVCAAPFEFDKRWYRARIMDICDDELNLFYLDYGDSGNVQRDQVKALRDEYVELPFQAVLCTLANAEPLNGEEWNEECIADFDILTHCAQWKVVMMRVVDYPHCHPASLHPEPVSVELVDTNQPTDVVILDELVKLGHARAPVAEALTNGETSAAEEPGTGVIDRGAGSVLPVGRFAQLPAAANGSLVSVSVTAVRDPHHFTVQLFNEGDKVEKLCDQMTEFYSNLGADELCLTNPQPGTICCATYAHDETWHRAVILEQLDETTLSVQYLDYGDIASVQIEHVKKLKEEYTILPFQVINCCMVNIEPVDGEKWSEEAIAKFESLTHLASWKSMLLNVVPLPNRWSLPSVEMFDPDSEGVSVAEVMVSDGLAVLAGAKTLSASDDVAVADPTLQIRTLKSGAHTSLFEPVQIAVEKARSRMEEEEEAASLPELPVWTSRTPATLPRKKSDSLKIAANFKTRSLSESQVQQQS